MANLKWIGIVVAVLAVAFAATRSMQSAYTTRSDTVFPADRDAIARVEVWTKNDTLALEKEGENWAIAGVDSLDVRQERIDQLFDSALQVKKETLVSKNPENWPKFSITDTSGTHVRLYDATGTGLAYAVFGRSQSDWSHNYVRTEGEDRVWLTDGSVMHMLYPRATYWGQKPAPEESETEGAGETVVDSPGVAEPSGGEMGVEEEP